MGWRISLYRLPKQTADKWKGITEEQYHTDEVWDRLYDDLTSECIYYDTLTDTIGGDIDKKLHSDFFINGINTDELAFYAISKEQFLNIIEEVRQKIIKWFYGRKVNDNGELGDYWKDSTSLYIKKDETPWTADSAMKANQDEWNHKANHWKIRFKGKESDTDYHYMNIDLKDKWKVSGAWSYEYLIFDLIHIYKIFDWDNDVLLAIGG